MPLDRRWQCSFDFSCADQKKIDEPFGANGDSLRLSRSSGGPASVRLPMDFLRHDDDDEVQRIQVSESVEYLLFRDDFIEEKKHAGARWHRSTSPSERNEVWSVHLSHSLLLLKPFQGKTFELLIDFTDASNDNYKSKEFIDLDEQKFPGDTSSLTDALDASFNRRQVSLFDDKRFPLTVYPQFGPTSFRSLSITSQFIEVERELTNLHSS